MIYRVKTTNRKNIIRCPIEVTQNAGCDKVINLWRWMSRIWSDTLDCSPLVSNIYLNTNGCICKKLGDSKGF